MSELCSAPFSVCRLFMIIFSFPPFNHYFLKHFPTHSSLLISQEPVLKIGLTDIPSVPLVAVTDKGETIFSSEIYFEFFCFYFLNSWNISINSLGFSVCRSLIGRQAAVPQCRAATGQHSRFWVCPQHQHSLCCSSKWLPLTHSIFILFLLIWSQ